MNRSDIIDILSKRLGMSRKQSSSVIRALFEEIRQELASGNHVHIGGFGKFEVRNKKASRYVSFKGFSRLKANIGLMPGRQTAPAFPAPSPPAPDRRADPRGTANGTAVVRVAGIPVFQFEINDVSENGSGLIVPKDNVIMRNIHVGQEIEIRLHLDGDGPVFQRARIAHITSVEMGDVPQYLIGIQILSRMNI